MSVYDKLKELNITLPPVATPAAAYVPFVRTGNLVFLFDTARDGISGSVLLPGPDDVRCAGSGPPCLKPWRADRRAVT